MRKFLSIILTVALSMCCVVGFAACGTDGLENRLDKTESQISDLTDKVNNSTNTELKNQIDSLNALVAANKQEAEKTIAALTARVTELESSLSAAETEIESLKAKVNDLTGLINTLTGTVDTLSTQNNTLSETITELKAIIESQTSGNAALKAKLDELQTQYNNANTTITSLSNEIVTLKSDIKGLQTTATSLETNVSNLQTSLTNAETRIKLLEAAVSVEPTVLNMGDTFTFKSPTGIPMFKVRLIKYKSIGGTAYGMDFNIERINIPDTVPINSYFTACLYNENGNPKYSYKITDISSAYESCGNDFSKTYSLSFFAISTPPEDVTYFIVGLPSDNDLDIPDEKKYIIPYAIYMPQ